MSEYDFGGYVTKANTRCTDGLVILPNAFSHCDGQTVPLVWGHFKDSPDNVLGHVKLENRKDGVYGYASFNHSDSAKSAKLAVEHGDITAMSIHATGVEKTGNSVTHGRIVEVSLVYGGANPGARIDPITIQHVDGTEDESDEAIMSFDTTFDFDFEHADENQNDSESSGKKVKDIYEAMSEEQKNVLHFLVGLAASSKGGESVFQSDGGAEDMKVNAFEQGGAPKTTEISHDAFMAVMKDAKTCGSLKQAFIMHADDPDLPNGVPGVDYGVANLDMLFPEYKNVRSMPDVTKNDESWVAGVLSGVSKVPFARIKTQTFDITADVARARGYIKGHLKKEEVIRMAQRVTGPTTVYKKQRMDKDDIDDIRDFNIVAYLKQEMQQQLRNEIARAILIGDGRPVLNSDGKPNEDKIDESCIRPIYKEDEFYAYHTDVTLPKSGDLDAYRTLIDSIGEAMLDYKGSGTPTMFTTKKTHYWMKRIEDKIGHRVYMNDSELAEALGVSRIVDVQQMEDVVGENGKKLVAIIVDLKDYTMGTNGGAKTDFFDDFDLDFNQFKYLYETRLSGALTRPDCAVIVEGVDSPALAPKITGLSGTDATGLGNVKANELQDNVSVNNLGIVNGLLHYKKGFKDFSKDPTLQEGYYVALKIENGGTDSSAEVWVDMVGSDAPAKKLDESHILVKRIGDVEDTIKQKLRVRIKHSSDGTETVKTYRLSGLVLG